VGLWCMCVCALVKEGRKGGLEQDQPAHPRPPYDVCTYRIQLVRQYPLLMDGCTVICKGIGVSHFIRRTPSSPYIIIYYTDEYATKYSQGTVLYSQSCTTTKGVDLSHLTLLVRLIIIRLYQAGIIICYIKNVCSI